MKYLSEHNTMRLKTYKGKKKKKNTAKVQTHGD